MRFCVFSTVHKVCIISLKMLHLLWSNEFWQDRYRWKVMLEFVFNCLLFYTTNSFLKVWLWTRRVDTWVVLVARSDSARLSRTVGSRTLEVVTWQCNCTQFISFATSTHLTQHCCAVTSASLPWPFIIWFLSFPENETTFMRFVLQQWTRGYCCS